MEKTILSHNLGDLETTDGEKVGVVLKTLSGGYSHDHDALREFFGKIANPKGWKYPINAIIDKSDFSIAQEAAAFIAGSPLEITQELSEGRIRVEGPGYYNCIGA